MFRTQRIRATLIRALSISLVTPAVATTAAVLISCQDESQPEYWVEKLSDNAWRARAVKKLDQFFEDAVTRANDDQSSPEVKALVDKIVEPLTATYVGESENLDEKARLRLIKLITTLRDPRTEPALTKALADFAARGRNGEDVKWAARAVADMKMESAADAMLGAYQKLRADSKEGGPVYRDLNTAMVDMAYKGWTAPLVERLQPTIEPIKQGEKNPQKIAEYRNQLFWQTTAAQVLGAIGDPAAVEPLLKVVLDPGRDSVRRDALVALVKIGKPATERAIKLLSNSDDPLASYAALSVKKYTGAGAPPKDEPHVRTTALVLGMLGHASAQAPMISALKSNQHEGNRAVLLQELVKLPASAAIREAFESGFEALDSDVDFPVDNPQQQAPKALPQLADDAASLFDPEMVPWLLVQAAKAKGDEQLVGQALFSAIKLMLPNQVGAVGAAVAKYGSGVEKPVFDEAAGVVKSCRDDVACYIGVVTQSANQEQKTQFLGIKAAYMVAILGDAKARDQLVSKLDDVTNGAVRFTAAKAIDHLTPKGSTEVADTLQKLVDANVKRGDRRKMAGDAPIKQVIYRLRSRANS